MTLEQFGAMLAKVDPTTRHHATGVRGNYTTWSEYEKINEFADGQNIGGWKIQVERYTTNEYDEVAQKLYALLQSIDSIAVEYTQDHEVEDERVTIRHIFDCEVL